MPSYPPPPATPVISFVDRGAWAATTTYAVNQVFTSPNGDRRAVFTGYTSGSVYGATDTTNTVALSPTYATLGTQFAPLGAAYKQAVATSGEVVSLGAPLQSNGIPIVASVTVTDLEIDMEYPAIGTGTTVFRFTRFRPSDQSELVLGTVSLAAGKRSDTNSHNNGGTASLTNTSLLAGDRILVRNFSVLTTTTYAGAGVLASVAFGGTLTTMPNPTATTTPTATPAAGAVTLNWTPGSLSTGTLVLRDNIPWALVGGSTYTDSNLLATDNHTYTLAAVSPGGISAISAGVTASPAASYTYYSQADGAPVSTDFATTLGTNPGTAIAVASNLLTITSGNVGGNAQQDRIYFGWIKDTNTHTAWRRTWKFGFTTSNALVDWYFRANDYSSTAGSFVFSSSITQFIQMELSVRGARVGTKIPGVNSGGFVNQTITGSSNASTTTSDGVIPFSFGTLNANGTLYGISVEVLPVSGGTQVINVRTGLASTVDDGSILTATPSVVVTLDSTTTSAFTTNQAVGGNLFAIMLGQQTSTTVVSQVYKESTVTVTALTAAGA